MSHKRSLHEFIVALQSDFVADGPSQSVTAALSEKIYFGWSIERQCVRWWGRQHAKEMSNKTKLNDFSRFASYKYINCAFTHDTGEEKCLPFGLAARERDTTDSLQTSQRVDKWNHQGGVISRSS